MGVQARSAPLVRQILRLESPHTRPRNLGPVKYMINRVHSELVNNLGLRTTLMSSLSKLRVLLLDTPGADSVVSIAGRAGPRGSDAGQRPPSRPDRGTYQQAGRPALSRCADDPTGPCVQRISPEYAVANSTPGRRRCRSEAAPGRPASVVRPGQRRHRAS